MKVEWDGAYFQQIENAPVTACTRFGLRRELSRTVAKSEPGYLLHIPVSNLFLEMPNSLPVSATVRQEKKNFIFCFSKHLKKMIRVPILFLSLPFSS
ncbi:MAG: hypothetical protein DRI57_25910 [Deltaproteobacteria bacterium]|nr:MAG: hypothetical protein DRI57_25910 [Deltaproteobacteria bacterium]